MTWPFCWWMNWKWSRTPSYFGLAVFLKSTRSIIWGPADVLLTWNTHMFLGQVLALEVAIMFPLWGRPHHGLCNRYRPGGEGHARAAIDPGYFLRWSIYQTFVVVLHGRNWTSHCQSCKLTTSNKWPNWWSIDFFPLWISWKHHSSKQSDWDCDC